MGVRFLVIGLMCGRLLDIVVREEVLVEVGWCNHLNVCSNELLYEQMDRKPVGVLWEVDVGYLISF